MATRGSGIGPDSGRDEAPVRATESPVETEAADDAAEDEAWPSELPRSGEWVTPPATGFDPIEPARGRSVELRSVLAWRALRRETPYVSGSVATAMWIATELPLIGTPPPAPDARRVVDAPGLLTAIQLLGRHTRGRRWATVFQNGVLQQDVLPGGASVDDARKIVERARSITSPDSPPGAELFPDAILQWDAVEVLAEASRLRVATNVDFTEIGIRHIAAAFFLTQAGQSALRHQGLFDDYPALRERMAGQMSETLGDRYGDNAEAWPAIIERVRTAPLLVRLRTTQVRPDYASDVVRIDGPDPLEAASDARALADVILLKAARPPLAIGVFGPWGSGKSTLMRRLQQEIRVQLAAEQANPSDDGELGRIGNAVQIEFSAWSFADSDNLWAALTAEIFDQLATGGIDGWKAKQRADLVGAIAARLSAEASTLNTASATVAEQGLVADQLEKALLKARQEKADAGREAAWSVLGGLLKRAEPPAGKGSGDARAEGAAAAAAADPLARAGDAILAAKDADGGHDDAATLSSIRALVAGARLSYRDTQAIYRWLLPLFIGAFAVLTGCVVFDVASLATAAVLGVPAAVFTALPYLGAAARLWSQFSRDRANRREAAKTREAEAAKALGEARAAIDTARRSAASSQAFVDTFRQDANAPAAPGLMLKYLLRESEDLALVRRQIGLINVVRRCFEQLAAVVRDMSANPEAEDSIDRIIIYIDDLDRCTSAQVVAILEAIHLLLAFDCFVVVVAVDPKWLAQSLDEQRQQFRAGGEARGRATPEDYLEKIFQLALQVRPLADRSPGEPYPYGAYQRFAASLLEPDRALQAVPADPPPTVRPTTPDGAGGVDLRRGFTIAPPDRPHDFDAIRLERVSLGPDETRLLLDLGVLAAKSPRAVKRMINVYRLIRIRESEDLDTFLRTGAGGRPTYWSVLLALACEIGLPPDVMAQLTSLAGRASDGDWRMFLEALRSGDAPVPHSSELLDDVHALHGALQDAGLASAFGRAWRVVEDHLTRSLELREFVGGLHAVARYSLRAHERRWDGGGDQ